MRFYETQGLIKPHRNSSGRRFYTEDDIDWMKFLLHLKGTGMAIADLKTYVNLRSQGDETIPARLALLKKTKQDFLKQFEQVQHHLQILNDKINWYEEKQAGLAGEQESFAAYLRKLGHSV